jgi:uracil-DNA glycosylase family 4
MTRLAKPKECAECPLYGDGLGFSNSEGHGTTNVTIVGEALGQNEEQDALPFRPQAQAGSLLERAFKRCGYSRDQFRITNVVRCRPPRDYLAGAPYEFEAIRHCRPYLDHEIATGHPKVILAAGGTAARELTGMSGEKQGVSHIRGYVIPARDTAIPVIPTFHPSFIRQGKAQFFGVLCHDLMRAVQYAKQGIPTPMPTRYQLTPSLDDALSFLGEVEGNPALHLTYDIETPTSAAADEDERDEDKDPTIVQIQFSLHPGEGIVFPWRDPYIDVAKRILACGNRKFGFYSHLFDDPRLRAVGCVFGGPYPEDPTRCGMRCSPTSLRTYNSLRRSTAWMSPALGSTSPPPTLPTTERATSTPRSASSLPYLTSCGSAASTTATSAWYTKCGPSWRRWRSAGCRSTTADGVRSAWNSTKQPTKWM